MDERRLAYYKHCFKEFFEDNRCQDIIKNIEFESTYEFLIRRAKNAKSEKEYEYFAYILKHYVKLFHSIASNTRDFFETIKLYDGNELCVWIEIELITLETPPGEEGYNTAYNLKWLFEELQFTVNGVIYTLSEYLDAINYDYSYTVED